MNAKSLRTERERTLYVIACVVSALCWIALAVSIVGAIYGVVIAAVLAIAHALFLAHVRGNGVRVGPEQLPEIWERVVRASQKLGLPAPPETYVLQSGGVLNAFATKLLGRRFIILYSQLLEACDAHAPLAGGAPSPLDFIIGHEVGHLAAGHLSWFLLPARAIPLLGPAYSRACEYTCDRCGEAVVGDLEMSSRALAILAAGPGAARHLNLDVFERQRYEAGGFWMAVYELNSSHPYLPKRIAALRAKVSPAPGVSRNPLSYPLAPMFAFTAGGASAGLMMAVLMIAAMAAIAIPSFEKYKRRAEEAAQPRPTITATTGDAGIIKGARFPWHISLPGRNWELMPEEQAHKLNSLADRWLTRPDLDAHILVIGEYIGDAKLSMEDYARAVIANGKKSGRGFRMLHQRDLPDGTHEIVAESTVNGQTTQQLYGLHIVGPYAYQVMAFAPSSSMPKVKKELVDALATFGSDQ